MKVTIKYAEETTLEQFADRHGLELEVTESVIPSEYTQFSAQFKGQTLPLEYCYGFSNHYIGFGKTSEAAIADFAERIQGFSIFFPDPTPKDKKRLKRIEVPRLVKKTPAGTIIPLDTPKRGFLSWLFS